MNAIRDSRWRAHAAPIIERVLRETAGRSEKDIRAALRDAYPFGPRQYHPYKMWCKEVRMQRFPKKRTRREKAIILEQDRMMGPATLFDAATEAV